MFKVILFASVLALSMVTVSLAAAPQMINYQGRLTDGGGSPVANATYSVVFTIYDAASAGTSVWTETQNVTTTDGLFTVLLGSVNPILDTVFNETTRYLGIAVAGDPEINPRTALVTAPYSFRTATVDGATGGIISGDVSIQSDLSVSGKATIGPGHTNSGLYSFVAGQNNTASGDYSTVNGGLNNIATGNWSSVGGGGDNTAGSLYATVAGGTNNTVSDTYSNIAGGIQNSVSGKYSAILGGFGDTISSNYSYLFGIKTTLAQDSTFRVDMPHIQFGSAATGFEFPPADGSSGQVMTTDGSGQLAWTDPGGGGEPSGWVDDGTRVILENSDDSVGIGTATPDAPVHFLKESNSATPAFGFHTEFKNIGSGGGIAAYIEYDHGNTSGISTGMLVTSTANSSDTAYGIGASANNDGSGPAKGGFFASTGSGAGHKYGIEALAENNASSIARGVYGIASNSGTGPAIGGTFEAKLGGTGSKWGVSASADANSTTPSTGVSGLARNNGTGGARGGYFEAAVGPGINKGVEVLAQSPGANDAIGYDGNVLAFGGGAAYGLNMDVFITTGSNTAYGVNTLVTNQGSGPVFGVNTLVTNFGSGFSYGGYFSITNNGSGNKYAVRGLISSSQANPVYAIRGTAINSGSGDTYGSYGLASSSGTGTHYGVYGSESAGGGGAAVYAAGDIVATGSKSAIVVTSQGERLMYAVEATEVWFEDIGRAQLDNGHAHIELDALFLETVVISLNNPMQVFVQLNGDCNGTYVTTGATGFDVSELQNGASNASFTYRVMAKRKGYAVERMRKTDAGKYDITLYPERKAEIEAYWKEQGDQTKSPVHLND